VSRLFPPCYGGRGGAGSGYRLPSVPVDQRSSKPGEGGGTVVEAVPAGLARRFGALFADWVLCVLASGLFASPVRDG
jgi:hypothetical protein